MSKNRKSAYDDVENVSGAAWPGSQMVARPRTAVPLPPARPVSRRTPVEVDAESGRALDENLARSLTRAAERAALRKQIDDAHPSERPMLEHIFGLNLPGQRDRA